VQIDQINLSGIVERYIAFKTSGSIKERTQTSTEMGISCQWLGGDQSSVRSLPCAAKKGVVVCGRAVCRKELCIN